MTKSSHHWSRGHPSKIFSSWNWTFSILLRNRQLTQMCLCLQQSSKYSLCLLKLHLLSIWPAVTWWASIPTNTNTEFHPSKLPLTKMLMMTRTTGSFIWNLSSSRIKSKLRSLWRKQKESLLWNHWRSPKGSLPTCQTRNVSNRMLRMTGTKLWNYTTTRSRRSLKFWKQLSTSRGRW